MFKLCFIVTIAIWLAALVLRETQINSDRWLLYCYGGVISGLLTIAVAIRQTKK